MTLRPSDASRRSAARRSRRFALAVAGTLVAVALLLALGMRFEFVASGFHAPFAMALGVVFTALLGAGLMALSFYSSRAGYDDAVRGATDADGEDDRSGPGRPDD